MHYLREIPEYFRHLIPTLSTTNINDDITVGEFGQGLRDHSFAATERTGNGSGSSLDTSRKKNVFEKCCTLSYLKPFFPETEGRACIIFYKRIQPKQKDIKFGPNSPLTKSFFKIASFDCRYFEKKSLCVYMAELTWGSQTLL